MGNFFWVNNEIKEYKLPLKCNLNFSKITISNWYDVCLNQKNVYDQLAILQFAQEIDPTNFFSYLPVCRILEHILSESHEVLFGAYIKALRGGLSNCLHFSNVFKALFFMHQREFDKAFECINKEIKLNNKYSIFFHFVKYKIASFPDNTSFTEEERIDLLLKCISFKGEKDFIGESVWYELSREFINKGEYKLVETYLEKQKKYLPNLAKFRLELSLKRLKQESGIMEIVEKKILQLESEDKFNREIITMYQIKSDLLIEMGAKKKILIKHYERVTKNCPMLTSSWRKLVLLQYRTGDLKKALHSSDKFINLCGTSVSPKDYYVRGVILSNIRDFFEAEINLRLAIILSIGNDSLEKKCSSYLERIITKKDRLAEYNWRRLHGENYNLRIAVLQKTLENMERGINRDEEIDDVYFLLFLEISRYFPNNIENVIKNAAKNANNKIFWNCLLTAGEYSAKEFFINFKSCEKLFNDWIPIYFFKSFYWIKTQKDGVLQKFSEEFEINIKKIKELSKNNECYNYLFYNLLSDKLISNSKINEAEKALEEFEKLVTPKFCIPLQILKSQLLLKQEKFDQSIKILKETVKKMEKNGKNEDKGVFYSYLSEILESKRKKQFLSLTKKESKRLLKEIISISELASKENPCLENPYYFRSKIYLDLGKVFYSFFELFKICFIKPNTTSFFHLAENFFLTGDFNSAERNFRVALSFDTQNNSITRECKKFLKKIRKFDLKCMIIKNSSFRDVRINFY